MKPHGATEPPDAKPSKRIWTWINEHELEDIKPSNLADRARQLLHAQDTPIWNKYLEAAQARHRDGELEIEDDATVSFSEDGGAYVLAWLWVYNSQAGLPDPDTDMEPQDAAR